MRHTIHSRTSFFCHFNQFLKFLLICNITFSSYIKVNSFSYWFISYIKSLTNSAYVPISALAVASSSVGGGALSTTPIIHNNKGPVIQEIVNTRNSGLDMLVNKFYSCISKVTHEPVEPLKVQVDNCYLQVFGTGSNSAGNSNVETYSPPASTSKISNTPPGILIEVP
jgi:hypothetical protein